MPRPIDFESIIPELRHFYRTRSRLPSFREMQRLFGYQSKGGVARLIPHLLRRNVLRKDRTGKLVPAEALHRRTKLLGTVQAGFPSPAEEELVHTISLDEFLIQRPEATYLVRVTGDSMIEAGIHPGDLVIVEKAKTPKTGDIVIAEVDGEWTLKRFEKRSGQVRLHAANKKYPVFTARYELRIAGVVIGCVRKY